MNERGVQNPVAGCVPTVERGVKVRLEYGVALGVADVVRLGDGRDQSHAVEARIGEASQAHLADLEPPSAVPGTDVFVQREEEFMEAREIHPASLQGSGSLRRSMTLTVMTWNVNSVRARLDHVLTLLAEHEPDVVCLQETKVDDQLFPRVPFLEFGYTVNVHGSKSQAGVATLTKSKPEAVYSGFREGKADRHARVLEVCVGGVTIYNLYVPNGTTVGSDAYTYKLDWLARLRAQLDACHAPTDDVLLVGDFNVAPEPRDVWDPAAFEGKLQYTDAEKQALQQLVDFGLTDCLRDRDGSADMYTWYDFRTGGFERGQGIRIDHVYATAPLLSRCTGVVHDSEPRGWTKASDHVPVRATFSS